MQCYVLKCKMKICLVNQILLVKLSIQWVEIEYFLFLFTQCISMLMFFLFSVFQLNCLRTGLRSVPLKNKFSEEFELAALLVQLQIQNVDRIWWISTLNDIIMNLYFLKKHFFRIKIFCLIENVKKKFLLYREEFFLLNF